MAVNNINSVVVTGNLTKDPELKETSSGTSVCELRLACNTPIKTDSGWDSRPNYFQITVWGGQGENVAKYLQKGSPVAVQGRLEWQSWESAEGEGKTNSRVVIIAQSVQFLSKPSENKKAPAEASANTSGDDDIPF